MRHLSAPTWGIDGPRFLGVYLLGLAACLGIAILARRAAMRSHGQWAGRLPTADEVALLTGGRSRAVYSSLAALRAARAVNGDGGRVVAAGDLPEGMSRLDGAIYEAIRRGTQPARLADDAQVASALDETEAAVARVGWLVEPDAQRRSRVGGFALLGLFGIGLLRTIFGIQNHQSVGLLVALLIITGILAVRYLLRPSRLTHRGAAAVTEVRRRHAYLDPRQSPAWSTYGPAGAAMGVALFGTAALWVADAAFAAHSGLQRSPLAISDTAGASGYGGGASCGGGGDGGGGGCGGCGGG